MQIFKRLAACAFMIPETSTKTVRVGRLVQEVLPAGQPEPGDVPQAFDHKEDVAAGRAEAGAHRGAPDVDDAQPLFALEGPPAVAPDGLRECAETRPRG